ncbi:Mitochondrial import inner membrane translocase, subunit Tim44 [Magnetospirillum sp. LM-5]|uniref:Tim44/TimA family putative adaptor protein n=1 Tax=Magnetospirillum sp. LM-5 TaxID=2681466 RepID=UPI00137DD34B|nr:Tim44/TimA family putative adaptor protein [Magnetospirillum sp. LM-5]CAA7617554.1 Mitochondrial import inner membrane translocase, subunit Tim44 [Magnetospirillum sp. LM-5]
MTDGFQAIDIIFFAVVAVFLVLRLRSVLGRRTGTEREPPRDWQAPVETAPDNVIDLARARKPATEPLPEGPLAPGIAAIRGVDPSFSLDTFLLGARAAFEMIVEAFAAGDKQGLRPLLADAVFQSFAAAIDERDRAGQTLTTELMGIRKVEPVEVRLDGSVAAVTVRFVSEQINVLKDGAGKVIDGDPQRMTDVTDEWTFRRDTRSKDPNWQLAATRSPEDEAR